MAGFGIKIKPTQETEDVNFMLERGWKRRFEKMEEQVSYKAAAQVLKKIKEKVPNKEDYKAYRKSLEVAQIFGLPSGTSGYAVYSNVTTTKAGTKDPQRTLITVKSKRRLKRLAPEITILAKYSPWTLSTIPFMPNKSDARLVYRRVNEREVVAIEKARKKDQPLWKRALAKINKQDTSSNKQNKLPIGKARGVSDLMFTALRTEFGQGGTKALPHWRPAIRDLKNRGIRQMMKDRDFVKALTDPGFQSWLRWPTKTRKRISAKVAQGFIPFQKKLGIK